MPPLTAENLFHAILLSLVACVICGGWSRVSTVEAFFMCAALIVSRKLCNSRTIISARRCERYSRPVLAW